MYEYLGNNLNSHNKPNNHGTIESLGLESAKKCLQNLDVDFYHDEPIDTRNSNEVLSQARRKKTVQKLRKPLLHVSLQAWNKTEKLLFKEVKQHRINPESIHSWEIARDSLKIYGKAVDVYPHLPPLRHLSSESPSPEAVCVYSQQLAPNQLAKAISTFLGALRQKYNQKDKKVIGFVSIQFHYTNQMLLQLLSHIEQNFIFSYFKVIDDHLFMPLQRAYTTAAKLDCHSVALMAAQHLFPSSTDIAKNITQQVIELYPKKLSDSGYLNNKKVTISSIRDVEIFQVYLWVCADKGKIAAMQQKLFSLCVMLYPTLKVSWEKIRQMLHLLGQVISERLNIEQANTLIPYFQMRKAYVFSGSI